MESTLQSTVTTVLTTAAQRKASHIHLAIGSYPLFRIDDELVEFTEAPILNSDFLQQLLPLILTEAQRAQLEQHRSVSFVKQFADKFRYRIDVFYQRGFPSVVFKVIPNQAPVLATLGLPKAILALIQRANGLVIIAGPYGSGRTTTAAAWIEAINNSRKQTILTLEKPTEYLFINNQSLIEQRSVGTDVESFTEGLHHVQEADVDVVAVGVTDELTVVPLILDAANAGRLVVYQMDTLSVVQTVEELLTSIPEEHRQRMRLLLATGLIAVIVQRLVPRIGGGLVLAYETLIMNEATQSLIRDNKIQQLLTIIQSSRAEGMTTLDQSLADLVKSGTVLVEHALLYAQDPEAVRALARR